MLMICLSIELQCDKEFTKYVIFIFVCVLIKKIGSDRVNDSEYQMIQLTITLIMLESVFQKLQ